jgi:hypothetical protein
LIFYGRMGEVKLTKARVQGYSETLSLLVCSHVHPGHKDPNSGIQVLQSPVLEARSQYLPSDHCTVYVTSSGRVLTRDIFLHALTMQKSSPHCVKYQLSNISVNCAVIYKLCRHGQKSFFSNKAEQWHPDAIKYICGPYHSLLHTLYGRI